MNKKLDSTFKANRDRIIRERHARGLRYKALWLANTSKAVAEEMGVPVNGLREAVKAQRPMRGITQAQIDEATPRIREGERHLALYKADSMAQICADWGMGNTTYERVIAEAGVEPDDPVHKFLTMRLVG